VLEVRRGDGVYVTSPEPAATAGPAGPAVEPPHPDVVLELTEVRRMFEPVAAAQAATRISDARLAVVKYHLDAMAACRGDAGAFTEHDDAFHRAVTAGIGNRTLTALLGDISRRTLCARVWRALTDADAADEAVVEHTAIYAALHARDPILAQATALLHVHTTERWLRGRLTDASSADQTTV
jgi:GntR family transcriptional repressor for pyruvate dehydrogenase complex